MRSTFTLLLLLVLFFRPAWAQEAAPTVEFTENKGQWDARAAYAAHVATGAWLFVEPDGLAYALTSGLPDHVPAKSGPEQASSPSALLRSHGLRVEFVQPLAGAKLLAENPAAGRQHYLRGNDPRRWAADVRTFRQLRYRELWPGTDLVLHESAAHQLEYDLLLAPGAAPARARLRYRGAEAMRLDAVTGNLLVQTSAGPLTELRPRAWQTNAAGQRQPVACTFELRGTEVGFKLGAYDRRRLLVIDPVVQFASYTGSTVENWGFAATHDAAGSLYTAGVVFEPGYPVTTGAYQTSFGGSIDIAIMKFNTATSGPGARAWATHLGGNNLEFPHSLVVNGRGELLMLGTTSSTNYPTTGKAAGTAFRGGTRIAPYGSSSAFVLPNGSDLIISRLSADGGRLRASTYLGGTGNDGLLDPQTPAPNLRYNYGDAFRGDLAVDAQGNVFVASTTASADFPGLAAGATFRGGLTDGLVTSLDSSLSQVRWTTLLGGSGADAAYSMQREDSGGLLVAGGTTSANFGGTANGYRPSFGGVVDGFVARLSGTGSLIQSTYLGSTALDQAYFVRRTAGGQVYVLGQTLTNNWPGLSNGVYGNPRGHQFIQQLAPDLRTAGFATVFGSGRAVPDISPTAFEVDCYGRLFVAGWGGGLDPNNGSTAGLEVTSNALQATTDGMDFYLMQLSDEARVLEYATFFGTSADDHVDGGLSRFDAQGSLYQAVCACNQGTGAGLPIPAGAHTYSPTNGSAHCNNAAFRFDLTAGTNPAGTDSLTVCARSGPVMLGGSPAGGVWTGTGVTGSVATGYRFTPDTARLGTFVLTYTSPLAGTCAGTGTVTNTRRITVLPQALARMATRDTTICLQPQGPPPPLIRLAATPAGGTFVGVGVTSTAPFAFDPVAAGPGQHQVRYVLPGTASGGRCPSVASVTFTVFGLRYVDLGPPVVLCANDPPYALGGLPPGGSWMGDGVSVNNLGVYVFTPSPALIGTHRLVYVFSGTQFCAPIRDTLYVRVKPVSGAVQVPADTVLCTTSAAFRLRGGSPAGGTWSGPGVTGSLATGFFFTPSPTLTGSRALVYTGAVLDTASCPARATRTVTLQAGVVQLSIPNTTVCPTAGPQVLSAFPAGGIWSGPGVTGSPTSGYSFTPSVALVGLQTLIYATTASTNPSLCPASGRLQVQVLAFPAAVLDSLAPISFCAAAPPHGVVLTAQPPGGTFGGPGVVGNRFNPTLAGPGRHVLTYTLPFLTCTQVVTTVAEVTLLAPIRLPADTVLCLDPAPFRLRATPAGGTWTGPNVTAAGVFTPQLTPGTSVLTYTLPDGCGTAPYRVTVPAQPTFAARWSAIDCSGNALAPRLVRFEATGPAAAQVQWDFGDGSAPGRGAVVEHIYAAGRYQPQASLAGGTGPGPCPRQVALPLLEVQPAVLPNVITPNGDGQNDVFAPRIGGCLGRLQIFSRWGQPVFNSPAYHNEWDGAGLPAGIYYYLLGTADGSSQLKGWVEIVR
ncbi:gliding motility-associated C-terminal domain-containing protein [Hymenobacter armeniacus]|uniref:Gliding motility-associated C-terminal domain-containing protein n=1 Tax=Hymenobacter armeniacus TaxID=2771358 RepID=A0ABR8JUF1_9BACT|nr:gliding motility-associated C-terminal domain-containing protein [Hymenobacter armeniacus]MBD2723619.1 gliding motility-associated C-terminal domain-containing protein [Hymenobacter armeniacus]